ncbi:hypothetical protein OROMI_018622 [Orobanche minor]
METEQASAQTDTEVDNVVHADDDNLEDNKRSMVWKHYLIIDGSATKDGKKRAQCIYCKKASCPADSHYGTTNMNRHLLRCKAYETSKLSQNEEGNVYDQEVYRDILARAIIKHGYAFSWVEHDGNRRIHTYLNNQVRHICRNTAKADCLKLHSILKADLKNVLSKVSGRICLTCDMWTSCQTDGYLCLTAHFVDSNWKLSSKVLNFVNVESPHTGKAMYSVVVKLLQEWGIENKTLSITLDNASSNDKMQDHMKNWLVDRGYLLRGGRKELFRDCVGLAGIQESKALWLDVPTRWNSTYFMLDRAILYCNAFKELALRDPAYKYFPMAHEWEMLEKMRDILEPFYDITMLFSGSEYPTSNLYFENVWRIAMLLKELEKSSDDTLRTMAIDMKSKFDKYWLSSEEDDYTTLFAFALVLDPRYKLFVLLYFYKKLYEDDVKARQKVRDVQFQLSMLFNEYVPNMSNNSHGAYLATFATTTNMKTRGSRKRTFDFMEDLEKEDEDFDCFRKTKLDLYLEEDRLDRSAQLDILKYWKDNEHRFGDLSNLARDNLTVPLTTVASESTFSIGGRILNKWRSSYLPENVEALTTARSWLYGYEMTEEEEHTGSYINWSATK